VLGRREQEIHESAEALQELERELAERREQIESRETEPPGSRSGVPAGLSAEREQQSAPSATDAESAVTKVVVLPPRTPKPHETDARAAADAEREPVEPDNAPSGEAAPAAADSSSIALPGVPDDEPRPEAASDSDEELLKTLDDETQGKIKVLRRLSGDRRSLAELIEQVQREVKNTPVNKGPKKRGWFGR